MHIDIKYEGKEKEKKKGGLCLIESAQCSRSHEAHVHRLHIHSQDLSKSLLVINYRVVIDIMISLETYSLTEPCLVRDFYSIFNNRLGHR